MSTALKKIGRQLESYGRGPDTMLAHITQEEARMLKAVSGGMGRNPRTGLREFQPQDGSLAFIGQEPSPGQGQGALTFTMPQYQEEELIGLLPAGMTPLQARSAIATFGIEGNPLFRTPEAIDLYKRLFGSDVFDKDQQGNVLVRPGANVLPIERQFGQEVLGIQTPDESVETFAEALGLGQRVAPNAPAPVAPRAAAAPAQPALASRTTRGGGEGPGLSPPGVSGYDVARADSAWSGEPDRGNDRSGRDRGFGDRTSSPGGQGGV